MKCEYCGQSVPEGAKYCPFCGASIPEQPENKVCLHCGKPLKPGAAFCGNCGTPAGSVQPPAHSVGKGPASKRRRWTSFTAIGLCAAVVFGMTWGFRSCRNPDDAADNSTFPDFSIQQPPEKSSLLTAVISPEQPLVTLGEVTVDAGEYVLDQAATLTVEAHTPQTGENGDWQIRTYDISICDMHQLDDFITIRIPYDDSIIEDPDESSCVGAFWSNEETGLLEPILCTVDPEANELIIETDHLSRFVGCAIRNQGRRNAVMETLGGSFLISDISSYIRQADPSMAVELFRRYSVNGGSNAGEIFVNRGSEVIKDMMGVKDDFTTVLGFVQNPMNIAALGSDVFPKGTRLAWLNDGLTHLGFVCSAATIAYGLIQGDRASILGAYREAISTSLNLMAQSGALLESASLNVALGAVWVFDFTINHLFEHTHQWKMDKIGAVYEKWTYAQRTPKEWRKILIDLAETNSDSPEAMSSAVLAEVEALARRFWDLDADKMYEAMDDAGFVRMGIPSKEEQETLTQQMVDNICRQLHPVAVSAQKYLTKKMAKAFCRTAAEVIQVYNSVYPIRIQEICAEGETPRYAGCKVRFAPLSKAANPESWTGVIRKDGTAASKCTVLAYAIAGYPSRIQVFEPDADPDRDQPILQAPLTVTEDEILCRLQDGEDFSGTYPMVLYTSGPYENDPEACRERNQWHFNMSQQTLDRIRSDHESGNDDAFLYPPQRWDLTLTAVPPLDAEGSGTYLMRFVSPSGSEFLLGQRDVPVTVTAEADGFVIRTEKEEENYLYVPSYSLRGADDGVPFRVYQEGTIHLNLNGKPVYDPERFADNPDDFRYSLVMVPEVVKDPYSHHVRGLNYIFFPAEE